MAVSPVPNLQQIWDLSPSGESLVGLVQDDTGATAIAIWSLGRNRMELTHQWPVQSGTAVRSAQWLTDDRLLIVRDDKLECLQLDGSAVSSRYQVAGPLGPVAWRADRRVAALAVESGIAILDLMAGQQLGWLSQEAAPTEVLEFSADGRQLFASSVAGLMSWDLLSGTAREPMVDWAGCQRLAALAGGYLLVDGSRLFNATTGQETWQYQAADETIFNSLTTAGGLACYVSAPEEGQPSQLVMLTLPDPEAAQSTVGREQGPSVGTSMLGPQGIQAGDVSAGGHATTRHRVPGH